MAPEKVDSYLETKGNVQETTIMHSSFLSYAVRSYYTLEFIAYGFHNRGILLVDIFEDILDKHVGKDRTQGKGLINLWPGSCGQLVDRWAVQQDRKNPGP